MAELGQTATAPGRRGGISWVALLAILGMLLGGLLALLLLGKDPTVYVAFASGPAIGLILSAVAGSLRAS